MTQVRDVGDPVGLPVDQRFPESSRDRGQGERVGFLESWQNGAIGIYGAKVFEPGSRRGVLINCWQLAKLSLSLSLSPRPFFKGVTTHVAATCSPLDWPRQHLRTVQYWNFQLCCVCRSGRAVEGEVLEFWTSFEEKILNRGEIILNFFQISNFVGFYLA